MVTATKVLTLEDFLELPEKKPALEFEDGRITQKVSPKGKHSALQYAVAEDFNRFARPLKLARAFPELRVSFAGVSRVPDLSLYRWERIPLDNRGEIADEFGEPPDLVVEIVSPKQTVNTLIRRCLWYVAHGVLIGLLVDSRDRSIILFRPDTLPLALRGDDQLPLDDVLPGIRLSVAGVFASLELR
jgi:Uma2 family endonuclease